MGKRSWWLWTVIAIVLLVVGWVFFISSKQVERNRRIQEEITTLETEATKIRRENETLSERISYFASDDFREQEAKRKLGLKKTEEIVVEVKPAPGYENGKITKEEPQVLPGKSDDGKKENYKRWWNIFFETN